MPRYSLKPGPGPSAGRAAGAILGVIFGILWTIFAIFLTKDAPFPFVKILFPLFGVVFVIAAIVSAFNHMHNATRPNRFSEFNVVPTESEQEPVLRGGAVRSDKHVGKYCTHCGTGLRDTDNFCSACGSAAN